ncbi:MAG: UbiA family prenyltransferase [Burkholderiales bacterium]|nr:UbiA family prenyltransferase [Phycisphaerae bacterium]
MSQPLDPQTFAARFALFAADIKISHSIFALPWAILATFLAALPGRPLAGQIALIIVCMIMARTAAMGANRLLDARLDAVNPRTARRAIPSGKLPRAFVTAVVIACSILFIAATSLFGFFYHNWLPLIASVPVLAFVCAYPFLKRFTRLCHYYLGAALALAPVCAWVAIAGTIDIQPLLMAAAVLLWTAGFDIIYACQDFESDRATGVYSVPARFGIARALWVARGTHVACVAAMIALGIASPALDVVYAIGVIVAVALLVIEHAMVKADDLSKVNIAFFTVNGVISVVLGTLGVIEVFI